MDQPWKVISAFMGVFIAGAVFGGFFTFGTASKHFAANVSPSPAPTQTQQASRPTSESAKPLPPARIDPKMMRQYAQRLNLTNEQRALIRPFMARAEEDLQRLRRQNLQDTTRVMERMYADIARSLTPEQQAELDKMKRTLQERLAEDRKKAQDKDPAKKNDAPAAVVPQRPPS